MDTRFKPGYLKDGRLDLRPPTQTRHDACRICSLPYEGAHNMRYCPTCRQERPKDVERDRNNRSRLKTAKKRKQ